MPKFNFKQYLESRNYFGTKGAGVLAFATDIKKWLVALRSKRVREPGTWGVIGGKIEENSPELAARREFLEETGYKGLITLHPAYIFQADDFIYYNFIGEIEKLTWEPEINWETDRFAWVSTEELIKLPNKHFGLKKLIKHSFSLIKQMSE